MDNHQIDFLKMLLKRLDESHEHLNSIEEKINNEVRAFEGQVKQLDGIPGIDVIAAASIIAEIGADMSVFKTSQHICSWAGLSPGNNESAGKKSPHA